MFEILGLLLYWYLVISYVLGAILFLVEVWRALESEEFHLIGFGIILLALSPLTAWHGLLHYLAAWWCRMNGKPFKPWI